MLKKTYGFARQEASSWAFISRKVSPSCGKDLDSGNCKTIPQTQVQ